MDALYLIILIIIVDMVCLFIGSAIIGFQERKAKPIVVPDPGDMKAGTLDSARTYAYLYPTGREVFFPKSAHAKPVYEITFTGLLRSRGDRFADARYMTDACGNFTWYIE